MTAQASDTFIYKDDAYALIGIEGEELAKPEDFGMTPEERFTSCWRGFFCTYEIAEESLLLKNMTLNEANENYKPINEVKPVKKEFGTIYKDINLPVPFT